MDTWELFERQQFPLYMKIQMSLDRIHQWYKYYNGKVYVSFSGGKDSTVLLHLVRSIYPNVLAVFVDTGLEFPEIRNFVKSIPNVFWLKPRLSFREVIDKYGYPIISKDQACAIDRFRNTKDHRQRFYRLYGFPNGKKGMISKKWQYLLDLDIKISDKCCYFLKHYPLNKFVKTFKMFPITGMMASESNNRKNQYVRQGCNNFTSTIPISWPIAFWTDKDIWDYIKIHNVNYSSIYDLGYKRTGCMFCMFGVHLEKLKDNRFLKMKITHPSQYDYCINKLGCGKALDAIHVYYGKRVAM
jgi:3'-phosphoadenosine 5'-phosphosulfate sulfotransferase (PAPS reductase)/FAD synthetase